jgi:hypothetical protein
MATRGALNKSRATLTDDGMFWLRNHPCAVVDADPDLLSTTDVVENVIHQHLTVVEGLRW